MNNGSSMKNPDNQNKIVILIDSDNAQYEKISSVLDEISTHGHIIIKRAYGDWSSGNLKNWKNILHELAIQPVQQFAYTKGKNSTDISIVIDAMDLLHSNRFDTFVLVSSDSDFTKLAVRLRESEIFVFGVGEKETHIAFRNACDDFIFTENLAPVGNKHRIAFISDQLNNNDSKKSKITELTPLLKSAWEQHQNNDGWVGIPTAGGFLKKSKPDFTPKSYGMKKLRDIISSLKEEFEMTNLKGKNNTDIAAYRPIIH
jgi:uncharacterized LabA/DUF88 family protein